MKKLLQQAFILNKQILQKHEEIERIEAIATKTTTILQQDKIFSSTNSDKIGECIAKKDEIVRQLSDDLDALIMISKSIIEAINSLDNELHKLVMTERYLNLKSWERIAVDINYDYRYVLKLHGRALQELNKNRTLKDT